MRSWFPSRNSRAVVVGACLAVGAVVAACGEDKTSVTSEPDSDRLSGPIDTGLLEQQIAPGRSSYLVLGGTAEGSAGAKLVVLDGDTATVSEDWDLGRWEPGIRLDAREAEDGSWLVGVERCADADSSPSNCADDAVALYRATPRDGVAELGLVSEVTGSNFAVAGGADDYVVLESGAPEPTEPSRFVRFDPQSGEVLPIETSPELSPSVRTGCVMGGRLAVLDGVVRPTPTAAVSLVNLKDPSDLQVVDVALPPGENPYWMTCEPGGGATVVSTDPERHQFSAIRVSPEGSLSAPDRITLAGTFQDAQFGPGTLAVVSAADVTPEEGAKAVEEGRRPEREGQLVLLGADGGWRRDPLRISADDSVRATSDGRSLLVSRTGSPTISVEPR